MWGLTNAELMAVYDQFDITVEEGEEDFFENFPFAVQREVLRHIRGVLEPRLERVFESWYEDRLEFALKRSEWSALCVECE